MPSYFILSCCIFHILLEGNNSGKIEYYLVENFYSLHIEFCHYYVNTCSKVRKSTRYLRIIELLFPCINVNLEIIINI